MLGWELLAVAGAALVVAVRFVRSGARAASAGWGGLSAACLAIGISQLLWRHAPNLLAAPGSLVSRLILPLPPDLRRALEPAVWVLVLCVLWCRAATSDRRTGCALFAAVGGLITFLLCGATSRTTVIHKVLVEHAYADLWNSVELGLGHLSILMLLLASLIAMFVPPLSRGNSIDLRRPARALVITLAALLMPIIVLRATDRGSRALLVGVHFYSWFPENWAAGFVGSQLVPPVLPALGLYKSDGPDVFPTQLRWMKEAGVNLIVFDWWAKRTELRKRIDLNVAQLGEHDPWFAIHYEPHDLKQPHRPLPPGEEENTVIMNDDRKQEFVTHLRHLAKRFFQHPHYLRIDGKPVLILYASRHMLGDLAGAIAAGRQAVREEIGVEPFVVGDEIYFNVIDYSADRGAFLLPEGVPNWDRVAAFDALTCYNAFDASRPEHGGSAGVERYFSAVEKLYRRYQEIGSVLGIEVFPGVLPGYNDRGVRPAADHFVFPRFLATGDGVVSDEHSFFAAALERLVRPFLSSRNRIFLVTSWNEWNEGSAIEPSSVSEPSQEDQTGPARKFTKGEWHSGYGSRYLQQLAAFVTTFSAPAP